MLDSNGFITLHEADHTTLNRIIARYGLPLPKHSIKRDSTLSADLTHDRRTNRGHHARNTNGSDCRPVD